MMKGKHISDFINKQNINASKNSLFFVFDDDVRHFENMAILRFDLRNSLPRSRVRTAAKVIHEKNQPINSYCFDFVQIGPCILKT